jgi:hypothetical protein
MCKTDLMYVVIWNPNVQDHGDILCMCACSTVLASQEIEPNLKSWQALFNEKEIIFAAGINSHNTY